MKFYGTLLCDKCVLAELPVLQAYLVLKVPRVVHHH